MRRIIIYLLFLCTFISSLIGFSITSYASTIKMGFIGGRSPERIVKQWSPLLDYLSHTVGETFEMVLYENFEDLLESFTQGKIDLFEGGAFTHIVAMETGKAEFLVGEVLRGSPTYKSIMVVRTGSAAQHIEDLKSLTLALTDELSTSGYVRPLIMLQQRGITKPADFFGQIVLTGSHERSLEALLEGAVDVAGVSDESARLLSPAQRGRLRILATSDPILYGPITVHRDLATQLKEKIRAALLTYHDTVSDDIRRIVGIERFTTGAAGDYATMKRYREEGKELPKLGYIAPYRRMPTVFAERISAEKMRALIWLIVLFCTVAAILGCALFVLRKRFSAATGIVIAATVAVVATLFTTIHLITLFSSINAFAVKKLGQMENLNLRAVSAIAGTSSESLNYMLATATKDASLTWANIYRNGSIIASSNPSEVGVSIIDQIRADTFNKAAGSIIPVLDPLIVGGKRYATAQLGLSFAPLTGMVTRAVTINAFMMATALLAGFAAAFIIKHRLGRPMQELSRAVEKLREGESVEIVEEDADLHTVTNLIATLGKELREKQTLIDLTSADHATPDGGGDPEVINLLAARLRDMETTNPLFKKIRTTEALGHAPAWLRCLRDAAIRARDREPAVINGPSGSGKTCVAHVIHALSPRAEHPLGEFNCAEFASGDPLIVLGKLFGYGADSGIQGIAREGQKGILEEFDGGTLFLDEVGILPMQAQQLLLLPLEGRAFNPAAGKGGSKAVNVRFIFATNEPLEDLVRTGTMRHDLLRRIQSRGHIEVPRLADRRDDIELLARHFLDLRNERDGKSLAFSFTTLAALMRYEYERYNVSELLGVVNQAFDNALFDHSLTIEPEHLSHTLRGARTGIALPETFDEDLAAFDEEERGELAVLRQEQFNITRAEKRLGFAAGSKTLTNRFRGLVYRVIDRNGGNIDRAAAELGGSRIDSQTLEKLRRKIGNYSIALNRHTAAHTTAKLLNNLPLKYRIYVERGTDVTPEDAAQPLMQPDMPDGVARSTNF